jgi:hypothetical protein
VRNPDDRWQGQLLANFVRGRGDMMGVAGNLNDNADITAPVFSYWPNDYGLYNMAGNVSEWVMDVYRPLSGEEYDEFRPFRGNVFKTKVLNSTGSIAEKYDETMYDVYGIKQYLAEFQLERLGTADKKNKNNPWIKIKEIKVKHQKVVKHHQKNRTKKTKNQKLMKKKTHPMIHQHQLNPLHLQPKTKQMTYYHLPMTIMKKCY